jgi:hypothetical protein
MSKITLTLAQVQEVADHIVGTVKSITQGLADCDIHIEADGKRQIATEYDLSTETLVAFDDLLFVCDMCGWICDVDERSKDEDESTCAECYDEKD